MDTDYGVCLCPEDGPCPCWCHKELNKTAPYLASAIAALCVVYLVWSLWTW